MAARWPRSKTDLVRNAAIAGLLAGSENVNQINAATWPKSAASAFTRRKQDESHRGGATTVLTIKLHSAAGESSASATVIRGEQPRLLVFDGIDIETPLEGNLLVCRNLDVPGVIGKIGTILGEHGVNIANFALGRERGGAKPVKALALVQVDAPVFGYSAGGAGHHRGAARGSAGDTARVLRLKLEYGDSQVPKSGPGAPG